MPSNDGQGGAGFNSCATSIAGSEAVGYRTAFFGFGIDAPLPSPAARRDVLARALKHCDLRCPKSLPFHDDLGGAGELITTSHTACNSLEIENATLAADVMLQAGRLIMVGHDVSMDNGVTLTLAPPDP